MTMTLVETVVVGSGGASSIEFTSIPQDGLDLVCVISARTTQASVMSNSTLRFNSDSGSNYSVIRLRGNGSVLANLGISSISSMPGGGINGGSSTSNTFANIGIYISNYTSGVAKSFSIDAVTENNATEAYQDLIAGRYSGTAGISSVFFATQDGVLVENSIASLYIIS